MNFYYSNNFNGISLWAHYLTDNACKFIIFCVGGKTTLDFVSDYTTLSVMYEITRSSIMTVGAND